jgi:uncharacterized LabA/DUF88 family protein
MQQSEKSDQEKQKAAVFIDFENLARGYRDADTLNCLSIGRILNKIAESEGVGDIVIKKAFANWAAPALASARSEILKLNIETVYTRGSYSKSVKNVADIYLAVDVIDVMHKDDSIGVFVIVSGDGGFAAVAKRLGDYGKKVYVASRKDQISSYLISACDKFIEIGESALPESNEDEEQKRAFLASLDGQKEALRELSGNVDACEIAVRAREIIKRIQDSAEFKNDLEVGLPLSWFSDYFSGVVKKSRFLSFLLQTLKGTRLSTFTNDQRFIVVAFKEGENRLQKDFFSFPNGDRKDSSIVAAISYDESSAAEILEKIDEVVGLMAGTNKYVNSFSAGMPLSVFKSILNAHIENFHSGFYVKIAKLGFHRFSALARYVFRDTNIRVWAKTGGNGQEFVLAYPYSALFNYSPLDPLYERGDIHSVKIYNSVLTNAAKNLNIQNRSTMEAIARYLADNYSADTWNNLAKDATSKGGIELEEAKRALKCFLSAECLVKIKEKGSEPIYELGEECRDPDSIMQKFKNVVRKKISDLLGACDERVLDDLLQSDFPIPK